MSHEEALAVLEKAKEATQKAREALDAAYEKVAEAKAEFQRASDAQRQAWVDLQDYKWAENIKWPKAAQGVKKQAGV